MQNWNVQWIALDKLIAHPKNANVTPADVMAKLRRHIARTGRYEPLVVRPHPAVAGSFELINGHHRAEILRSLEHTQAACVVWSLDDAETLLLLATVNRLGGEDAPGKRLELLESLAAASDASAEALAELLPESAESLRQLLAKTQLPDVPAAAPVVGEMPEAFTVFLAAAEKARLVKALKATAKETRTALMIWAADREVLRERDGK
jgi:ParB-like chromosome segregation protein Spo0J